jgi:2-succinyl-6-hydroxy-2,4-cyclohexadiene-1-carboxylate synthase
MAVVKGADVRLHYEVSGAGTPVTLLHGFTQTGHGWHEIIAKMPAGWTWIVPDLRGHGQTRTAAGAPCTLDACAGDLVMLWDHLGLERSHLVGYSMGGRLALHAAVTRPERIASLMSIGAHAGLDPDARADRRQSDEELARRIKQGGLEAFVDYWGALPLFAGLARRGPAFNARLRAQRLSSEAEGLAASLRGMGAGAMEPLWSELARITVPCTFVAGEEDRAFVDAARRMGGAVPNGKVEIVPGAGHAVQLEKPAAFARLLASHLRRAEAAARADSSDGSDVSPMSTTSD